jgi:hypothetical protein
VTTNDRDSQEAEESERSAPPAEPGSEKDPDVERAMRALSALSDPGQRPPDQTAMSDAKQHEPPATDADEEGKEVKDGGEG